MKWGLDWVIPRILERVASKNGNLLTSKLNFGKSELA